MRLVRSRPGIIVWCALALLVSLVPLWRLRATRQWQSPIVDVQTNLDDNQFRVENPSRQFGLSARQSRVVQSRFPDQSSAQLAALDIEKLVEEVQTVGGTFKSYYNEPEQLPQLRAQLQKKTPQVWNLTDPYFAQYEKLERRFPNSKMVRAQHLRDVMRGELGIDEGPPPKDAAPEQLEFFAGVLKLDAWISPQQSQSAIQAAREGARLAPDNAFFPWMEALLQFSAERPNEALRALEKAGQCSTFDDYVFQGVSERLELLRRLRSVGWEDEFTEWALAGLPHLAKMRSLARGAVGQMRLARRGDKPQLAYRWFKGVAAASYVVARSEQNTLIGALVGEALCKIVWRGAVEEAPNAPKLPARGTPQAPKSEAQYKREFDQFYLDNAAILAEVARTNGDAQLASATRQTARNFDAQALSIWMNNDPRSVTAQLQTLAGAYWLQAQLLRLALGAAAVWCLFWGVTRRLNGIASARTRLLLPVMFGAGATGAILLGARSVSPQLKSFLDLVRDAEKPPELWFPLAVLRDQWPLLLALMWAAFVFGGAIWHCARGSRSRDGAAPRSSPRWLHFAGWMLLLIATIVGVSLLVQSVLMSFRADWPFYALLTVLALVSLVTNIEGIRRTQGRARMLVVCLTVAFWMTVAAFTLSVVVAEDSFFYGQFALLGAISVLVCSFGLILQIQDFAFEIAARIRVAAGALALLGAVAYVGIALWTIPVERDAHAMMARQLQIGEVAWLREQMADSR